jgi:hypothetical protein
MSNVLPLVGHMTHEQKAAVRTRVAAVVDRLTTVLDDMIAALDQLDGDGEAEHDGREPELGWTPQEAARLCPYDSRGLEQALEGSDDEREHACTDDNGIGDGGGLSELWDYASAACDAFQRERERTDPAGKAMALLASTGRGARR